VRKKNGQHHVYVDFWDLNNACPKDDFPLPVIELMIDATIGHEALPFMDYSAGYNQIQMALNDQDATTFRMRKGTFCYKVMPFGLKNTEATYQRATQAIFENMLYKTVECYGDDPIVKYKNRLGHFAGSLSNLQPIMKMPIEDESPQVCIWCHIRQISGHCCSTQRNRD